MFYGISGCIKKWKLINIIKLNNTSKKGKRVNQSHYRPGVAQRVPGSLGSQIS
jgi:hypothetical protein